MNNVKIFRARRGEGKTKWLVERAAEEYAQGLALIYLGSSKDFDKIREVWFAVMGTACPIEHVDRCMHISFSKSCFFTDELLKNTFNVSLWCYDILDRGCKWYITMSQEDFVN